MVSNLDWLDKPPSYWGGPEWGINVVHFELFNKHRKMPNCYVLHGLKTENVFAETEFIC